MRFFINEKEMLFKEYQKGKIVDGKFWESVRELEKYGYWEFDEKWDNAEEAINIITDNRHFND